MVTAHYLNKRHDVTIFEREPILGGNIRTLNKNVQQGTEKIPDGLYIDNGVIEFDKKNFSEFHALMEELGVETEQVFLTSGYFAKNARHYFSPYRIFQTESSWSSRARELLRLGSCYVDFFWFMLRTARLKESDYKDRPSAAFFRNHTFYRWLKMLLMYAYSIPYEQVDQMPAELGIPVLRRCALFTEWTRVKHGVYTYIEKILEQFNGTVRVGVDIAGVSRAESGVSVSLSTGESLNFDKVVFAATPDQVLKLLSDPTENETLYFKDWQENVAHTTIHIDPSIYADYSVTSYSAFDVFEKDGNDAGYNGFLNPLIGLDESSAVHYNLSFNLDEKLDPTLILHTQQHRTPLYTVSAFRYRDQVIKNNGSQHTLHAGAYLSDGLHEGAVRSAQAVAKLLGCH